MQERKMQGNSAQINKMRENSAQISKTQENIEQNTRKKELLADEIKGKLDWYIMNTAEEDYDEKVVESFLGLLDRLDPLKKEMPKAEDAWIRFQKMIKQKELQSNINYSGEIHDGRREDIYSGFSEELQELHNNISGEMQDGRKKDAYSSFSGELHGNGKEGAYNGVAAERDRTGDMVGDVSDSSGGERHSGNLLVKHRYITAAILLALTMGALGTVQAIAGPDTGFFLWLKRDETGTEMITSPENLDGSMGARENVYYNKDDVPKWAQEWLKVEEEFEMPEEYAWERYEVNVVDNVQSVVSFYKKEDNEEEFLLGMILYANKISYNRENFLGYSYIESYEIENSQMGVYSKVEESGKIYNIICFEMDCNQYFIRGQDDLEELKGFAEKYYNSTKK